MRDPEYDRFGPWIIEISELDPPPPLFVPYLTREEETLLSIKIPRKIERRNARPGMNLYDYMVNLYREDMVILERVGHDVRSETFFYRDIHCLRLGEHLLQGNLRLFMSDRVFDIPYNTVSQKIIRRLVTLLRQRYAEGVGTIAIAEEPDRPQGEFSFLFTRLLAREKVQNPENRVLAMQTDTAVGAYETGIFRRLLFGVISKKLLESYHLCDGRELKIVNRGQTYKYRGQSLHGADIFYIPADRITGVTWQPDLKNSAVFHLFLQTAGGPISFAFIRDNPTLRFYDRFLAATAGLAEGPGTNWGRRS